MESGNKIFAFDLDGTLAESKLPITERMSELLLKLSGKGTVVVISGGSFKRFEAQLLSQLKSTKNIILLPTDGSERFEYDTQKQAWELTDKEVFPLNLKNKVLKVLDELISTGALNVPKEHSGPYIEDRETQITLSALGQDAPLDIKKIWDPDQKKRLKIKAQIEEKLTDVTVSIAGTTSIDILPKGFNKASGLKILLEKMKLTFKDLVYVGDALFPGGNDYSVFEAGMKTVKVSGPGETEKVIEGWLANGFSQNHGTDSKSPIAFFCAEYALEDDPSMYAGGLGVLAGDYLLEIAKQNVPFVAFGLKYGIAGDSGSMVLEKDGVDLLIEIPLGNEMVKARVWQRRLNTNVSLYLLDTNITPNTEENKKITQKLYDSDFMTRLKQQIVLGLGGMRLIQTLGITPSVYHLNEGHTAFAGIGVLVERPEDGTKIVATKHTILSEAGLHVTKNDFFTLLSKYCELYSKGKGATVEALFKKGKYELEEGIFSTTKFIINSSVRRNGVSPLHVFFEKERHPQSFLIPITNGIYKERWQAPELGGNAKWMPDKELWKTKRILRSRLGVYIERETEKQLNPDICTVVWARRFASYKRPGLLFSDYERLIQIVSNQNTPVQFIISGKAHPADMEAQQVMEKIRNFSNDPRSKGRIILLPNYSLLIAKELVMGADVWLNTPIRGREACGTSGMKAGLNGALQFSISDGWIDEAREKGELDGSAWILPDKETVEKTADALYDMLEHEVLPCFYNQNQDCLPKEWIVRMRKVIELVNVSYNTTRMAQDYRDKLYML